MSRFWDDLTVSLCSLKRFLKRNGLSRVNLEHIHDSTKDINQAVCLELEVSSRCIHRVLLIKIVRSRKEDIPKVLLELDPNGVNLRRKCYFHRRKYRTKGPNYLWHIDYYYKLQPSGFSIHGCIYRYSTKVIWLEVGVTNKVHDLIATDYLDIVSIHGC